MHFVRPIREEDFPQLVELAGSVVGGLTSLPKDAGFLRERIDDSLRAFDPKVKKPGSENYLFVLEDAASGKVVGTAGIAARVGGYDPFYSYEIRPQRLEHKPLQIEKTIEVLHLKTTHRGPTEIGSLLLHPEYRRGGLGRLLSLSRFLFIGAFPQRFDATIIAELRGYIDQRGKSPFWESVGRHFFQRDFSTADFLCGLGQKQFIADLMPQHPIYVSLLRPAVQAVIGRVHHDSEPALRLLLAEGFARTNEVDIFDAGPQVRAQASQIRTIAQIRTAPVRALIPGAPASPQHLLANSALEFRACLGAVTEHGDGVGISRACAEALRIGVGDSLSFSPLK